MTGLMPSISQDKGNHNSESHLAHHVDSIDGPLCVHPLARAPVYTYQPPTCRPIHEWK
ncbi:hypothetical protein CC2G_014397 [Coprinopsis cinerea AmutBmut pab1-1]|nr:hypothetical protein CC2G_014397 [Coprinopsis cinerea AmutBmut pab1-1]